MRDLVQETWQGLGICIPNKLLGAAFVAASYATHSLHPSTSFGDKWYLASAHLFLPLSHNENWDSPRSAFCQVPNGQSIARKPLIPTMPDK